MNEKQFKHLTTILTAQFAVTVGIASILFPHAKPELADDITSLIKDASDQIQKSQEEYNENS